MAATNADIERSYTLKRIQDVAGELGLSPDEILPYGHHIAKIPAAQLEGREDRQDGKLILVTAMTPTPQGEGKTTTTVGLGDGLRYTGHKAAIAIREPSMGPCFGIKGGGTGAGHAQVAPSQDINLQFTGDLYAVTMAHNLLASLVDNHLHFGNAVGLDPRQILLKRVMDLNDRALRETVIGLGGTANGIPRQSGFDITTASEIMAILCMANSLDDLHRRLGSVIVGFDYDGKPLKAEQFDAAAAMQLLLEKAIHPNLVQTLQGTPAFVHGGPFANIAQGTNSITATRMALKLADYVVTEAGFASDLGAEKFFHIKCRAAGLRPSAVVIVATCKAIAYHGEDADTGGFGNLAAHIENIQQFGLKPVVAISRFDVDTDADIAKVVDFCDKKGVEAAEATHFQNGGAGTAKLSEAVLRAIDANAQANFDFLYPLDSDLKTKIETVATRVYGADGVDYTNAAEKAIAQFAAAGYGELPICVAKSSASLSDDGTKLGRPRGFRITVSDLSLSAGAGFVVVLCGSIRTMPGLPRQPAAARIAVNPDGTTTGLP